MLPMGEPDEGPFFAAGSAGGDNVIFGDVGAFNQGDGLSRWALGRYLLGRALAVQISRALLLVALVIAAIGVGSYFAGSTALAILIGLVAVFILMARAILGAVLRRTTVPSLDPDGERRLAALVGDTRKDVVRELRRIGLPSRSVTMPLLAFRLAGRRRAEVMRKLRDFEVERVVSPGRLDEVHLLMAPGARRGDRSR
jgi:hypothetical protein